MRRRDVLAWAAGAAALGRLPGTTAFAAAAPFADYRALVSVFLLGGNDAFNMVVPRAGAEYGVYAASRQNLALAADVLLPIAPEGGDGVAYGLHPEMAGLQQLFERGDAAVVANVGPLVQPVTRAQYLGGSAVLPPQLFSHNDQQAQWQTLRGRSRTTTGWAGRIADVLAPLTSAQQLALNVSTAGTVAFLAGEETVQYTMGTQGATAYSALAASAAYGSARRAAFEQHIGRSFPNVHARALADVHARSLALADRVNAALAQAPVLATPFPAGQLAAQLRVVARMIAVRDQLAMSRQIFHVSTGGFDTHDTQNEDQPALLANVSASLAAFQAALVELGVADAVVTFTQSDFGRTLTSNGDGTDHGWGSHQLVLGGPVRGRRIYGTMPRLEIGGPDDAGAGRIIPTQSADQYAATLARWFGVDDASLATVAPHAANFATADLGFLA
jgi:uncharacterized protein (DUF1501 family)